jgi:hypothetical protein
MWDTEVPADLIDHLNPSVLRASFYPCTLPGMLVFRMRIRAWVLLGVGLPYQLVEAKFGFFSPNATP